MNRTFDHCESIYWVFTQLCNDKCDHCYNMSGPTGERLSHEECMSIIEHLPTIVDRIILSGGEPLAEKKLLYDILDALQVKFGSATQIMLQTNGDLLTGEILDTLISKGVSRFDIASIDRYHKHQGERLMDLASLFESRGVNGDDKDPLVSKDNYLITHFPLSWGYWGATEEMWLGGNWARGRAMETGIWKKDGAHNFCNILSGGIGFLTGGKDIPQEISIQLWKINPCCPGTVKSMGDARKEKIADVLYRASQSAIFRAINDGDPYAMGESIGITTAYATDRVQSLGNVCLWCDEFFTQFYDIEAMQSKFDTNEE